MSPLVFDYYKSPVRITLTAVLILVALGVFATDAKGWATLPLLLGGIAFHTECRLELDPTSRTYVLSKIVKPFGLPKTGSFEDIDHVLISTESGEYGRMYRATLVFKKAQKFDDPPVFQFSSGTLDRVLDDVANLVRATGTRIEETGELKAIRKGFDSMSELLAKHRQ